MKVSLYTISLSGGYYRGDAVPLLDIFPLAKEWGYDGVEIEGKRPHGSPLDLDGPARSAIRQAAEDNGLELSAVAAYNDFSSPVEEHRENEMLMVRELIRLAADLGSPIVRVFAAWSGVTLRDGCITYDVARYNIERRYPGTTALERWEYVRECLVEVSRMAQDYGVVLALQNHAPITSHWDHVLQLVEEVNSPALKVCLDAPLMQRHTAEYYREAITATGDLLVHTHFGGRFERDGDGRVTPVTSRAHPALCDYPAFLGAAKELVGFDGHIGYELCSPVLTGHRHAGIGVALDQAKLACAYMRQVLAGI
jgi:sugar phosphate isomerase/epimerase